MPTDARQADAVPALNGPPAPARDGSLPSDEELAREIVEFEKKFPAPDLNDIRADAEWFDVHAGGPELARHRGGFVAVLNAAVVGHGPNALLLQLETAKRLNVHPQRFVLEYVPRPTF